MLRTFASPPRNNYFAPEWRFDFFETKLQDSKLIENLKILILEKEQEIIKKYPYVEHDGGTGLGLDSLTARFPYFNVFTWTEEPFVAFQNFVKEEYLKFLDTVQIKSPKTFIGCWANVMREGQSIEPHWHSCFQDSFLGGHFVIACENTATFYQNPYLPTDTWPFDNSPGNLTFFPSHLMHWTSQHMGSQQRITIAFDIVTENYIKDFPKESKNYVEFV